MASPTGSFYHYVAKFRFVICREYVRDPSVGLAILVLVDSIKFVDDPLHNALVPKNWPRGPKWLPVGHICRINLQLKRCFKSNLRLGKKIKTMLNYSGYWLLGGTLSSLGSFQNQGKAKTNSR